jgi:predicted amidohydrolase
MKITLAQIPLVWESPKENLSFIQSQLSSLDTDLLVLPEMFTTGFTMKPELHAELDGADTLRAMQTWAKQLQAAVTGSVSVSSSGKYYNRLFFVNDKADTTVYDKRHLFRMGEEHLHYTAGNRLITVNHCGWRIRPLVCYDLRFPVWSRNRFNAVGDGSYVPEYDLLLFVANWPAVRAYPWRQLLIARAIENQCFVVGVNRVGMDGNGVAHTGNSLVIDPLGKVVYEAPEGETSIKTVQLDRSLLEDCRAKFKVGFDADLFRLEP